MLSEAEWEKHHDKEVKEKMMRRPRPEVGEIIFPFHQGLHVDETPFFVDTDVFKNNNGFYILIQPDYYLNTLNLPIKWLARGYYNKQGNLIGLKGFLTEKSISLIKFDGNLDFYTYSISRKFAFQVVKVNSLSLIVQAGEFNLKIKEGS